jgi:hypothetical protein
MSTIQDASVKRLGTFLLIGLLFAQVAKAQTGPNTTSVQRTAGTTTCGTIAGPLSNRCEGAVECFSARSTGTKGTKRLRRPGKIVVIDLNPVRYRYRIDRVVAAISEPVDFLKLGFLPVLPSAGAPTPAAGPAPPPAAAGTQSDIDTLKAKIVVKQAEIDALRNAITATDADIRTKRRAIRSTDAGARKTLRDLEDLEAERRAQVSALEALQQELQTMQKQLAELEAAFRLQGIADEFDLLGGDLNKREADVAKLESDLKSVRDRVNGVSQDAQSFIDQSDGYDPNSILARIGELVSAIDSVTPPGLPWPDDQKVKTDLQKLDNDLVTLPSRHPKDWADWLKQGQNQATYNTVVARVQALKKYINDDLSKFRQEWEKLIAKLRDGRAHFTGICRQGESAFVMEELVSCKDSPPNNATYNLIRQDLAGGKELAPIPMFTLECSHPISLSTGIAFSRLNEDEFGFENRVVQVDGNPTIDTFKVITSTKRSNFRPVPLLLINTRLWDFSPDYSLNFSFGAGVDIKTGKTGTDIEFLLGPSLKIQDRFFVTFGTHIGRVVKLAEGFNEDDRVPGELTEVPTRKEYKAGFGIAFSFRVK